MTRIISRSVPVNKVCLLSKDKASFSVDCLTTRDYPISLSRVATVGDKWTLGMMRMNTLPLHVTLTSGGQRWGQLSVVRDRLSLIFFLIMDRSLTSSKGSADLLIKQFDSKSCRDTVPTSDWPPAEPIVSKRAFRAKNVMKLLALNSHGSTDLFGIFLLFFKKTDAVLAPKLSVVFSRLIQTGSFPVLKKC